MNTKDRNRTQTSGRPVRRQKVQRNRPARDPELQVQYTPAKTFSRNRFLLRLLTVAAVVLAIVLGMSIFFKIGQVNVAGAQKYTEWEIREASGIQDGDALLSLSEARVSARIRAQLPYVGDVRVGIKLPDTVNIEITELEVVYSIEDVNGAWWLIDASGRVVDKIDTAFAQDYTRVLGVRIYNPQIGQAAKAAEPERPTESQDANAITIPTLAPVPATQLLDAAIQVLTALENNGVMGVIESVDVSDRETIVLWYGDRFQVSLGDTTRLNYKVGAMKSTVEKTGQYQTGYMDVSFTIWPDKVHIQRFEEDSGRKN